MARKRKRSWKWPGLSEAAKTLGVSYGHARLVLNGERESANLLARLIELTAKETEKPSK